MLFRRSIAAVVELTEAPDADDDLAADAAGEILCNAREGEQYTYTDENGNDWTGSWTYKPDRDTCWEFTGKRY